MWVGHCRRVKTEGGVRPQRYSRCVFLPDQHRREGRHGSMGDLQYLEGCGGLVLLPEDRSGPAPRVPQERQGMSCTPASRSARILGGGHNPIPVEAKGIQQGMVTNRRNHEHTALRGIGDEKHVRRHHTHRETDRARRTGQGDF